jgi:hypothetical protein
MVGLNLGRTRHGMAVGALMLTLSLTTLGANASAAPQTHDSQKSCAALAAARNDAVHTLHDAWKGFREDLKDLAKEVREVDKDARHTAAAVVMTKDARDEVADARHQLDQIWTTAHAKIQSMSDLGQACKDGDDEDKDKATDQDKDKDKATDEDKDKATDQDKDKDAKEDEDKDEAKPTTKTTNAPTATDLAAQLKPVVDQAIKDMKAVVDDVTAAVAKMTETAQNGSAADAAKVKAARDHERTEHGRPAGRNGKGSRG